jgi:hypothetical protein
MLVAGNSMGTNWKGHYTASLLDFYGRSRRIRANDLSETVKLVILLGRVATAPRPRTWPARCVPPMMRL